MRTSKPRHARTGTRRSTTPARERFVRRTPTSAHAALDDPYLEFVLWQAAGRPALAPLTITTGARTDQNDA
ncbi:MAG TPA: hypothetical protein VNJ54_05845 [Plantibacter sp.]|uniref:hypothetical protein n=1 Tax=unclassified Plantibacter TaxID=2624265 RepID=UPI002CE04788|nr:hypothetical protein [Plantibacter sp.]